MAAPSKSLNGLILGFQLSKLLRISYICEEYSNLKMKKTMSTEKRTVWSVIIKVIIAVTSVIAGALGISACTRL